jgi:hypothetical protein
MAIKLNKSAFENAQKLIKAGEVEHGTKWSWAEHQATNDEINKFLTTHSIKEYGLWFLAIDTAVPENDKSHYQLPYGDLRIVHRNALVEAKRHIAKQGNKEVEEAIDKLLALIQPR